jgi:threonine/homoserine/homoserine lactone efflux protein
MLTLAITGLVLGVAYAAVPGAVNAESVRRALHGGFRSGFHIQFGSLVGDAVWALLGLSGAAVLLRNDTIAMLLGFVGASLLLWLARQALLGALFPGHDSASSATGSSLRVGLAFGIANPAGIPFWTGLGATIFGTATPGALELAVLLVGFLAGALVWGASLVQAVAWGGRRAGTRLLRLIDAFSATILGWFGIRLLWSSLQRLRPVALPALRALT